jgi:hypothetical protein
MRMRVQSSAFVKAAFGIVFILALSTSVCGQGSSRQSARDSGGLAGLDMQSREWALTHVPDEVNKHFKKEQVSLFAQIREDFTRLQLVDNEMMQTVFVKKDVDLKIIATSVAEINKRASRLRSSLVLPKIDNKTTDENQDPVSEDAGLQARLRALDTCITNFVTNPLFRKPQVVEAQLASKASRDLGLIIQLSRQVRTSLIKHPKTSQ